MNARKQQRDVPAPGRRALASAESEDRSREPAAKESAPDSESSREVPYVPKYERNSDIQEEHPRPIPVMPSNASGSDKVPASEEFRPIDEASMYEQRPERDKDRPIPGRGG